MVERLGDASTGLHGEQELRLAELQRSNDRLVHEVAQRDDEWYFNKNNYNYNYTFFCFVLFF